MKLKKYFARTGVAFFAMALSANAAYAACATDSLPSSMDKPGGYPARALTMVVPYGPAGGSGQRGGRRPGSLEVRCFPAERIVSRQKKNRPTFTPVTQGLSCCSISIRNSTSTRSEPSGRSATPRSRERLRMREPAGSGER